MRSEGVERLQKYLKKYFQNNWAQAKCFWLIKCDRNPGEWQEKSDHGSDSNDCNRTFGRTTYLNLVRAHCTGYRQTYRHVGDFHRKPNVLRSTGVTDARRP